MACLDYLSQVRRAREEIQHMGAVALAVGGAADYQARALMAEGAWFSHLLDPEKRLYRALGITRIGLGWFDPIGWASEARAFFRGARQGWITDPLQAPGVAILDAEAVARWVWRGKTLGDYPPLSEALAQLRSVAVAR